MSKTPTRKRKKTPKPKPTRPKLGIPTVAHRLNAIERHILAAAAILNIEGETDQLTPKVSGITLHQGEVVSLCRLFGEVVAQVVFLESHLTREHLTALAPTDDQFDSLEPIYAGGAR